MIEHPDVQFHTIVTNNKPEVTHARNMSDSFTLLSKHCVCHWWKNKMSNNYFINFSMSLECFRAHRIESLRR